VRAERWIASRSLSSGAHARDPLAPLRKRFAFVAGNDESSRKEKRPAGVTPPASLATAGSGPVPLRFHDGNPA
jgi:hypothetical protein